VPILRLAGKASIRRRPVNSALGLAFTMPELESLFLALFTAAALAAAYYSPFAALRKLQRAASNDKSTDISALIDAPSIQRHLQDRLASRIATRQNEDGSPSVMAPHATGVASAWAPALLALSTTPQGMRRILLGLHPTPDSNEFPKEATVQVVASSNYESPNRFTVTVRNSSRETQTALTLSRRGIFGWKVSDIRLP
jgi:hypothetical protein